MRLPEKNTLPLDIREAKKRAEGAESIVWETLVQNPKKQSELIALKQIRREEFASDAEMQKSKKFYEFLKNFPGFGKFVPDTLYFKARMSPNEAPKGYSIQRFLDGEPIHKIKNEELYKDPKVVEQLLDFAEAAIEILRETREKKIHKPDFGVSSSAGIYAQIMGNALSNPRFSTNIVVTPKPDEKGRRVFFVDTGVNPDERTSEATAANRRKFSGRFQEAQLERWAKDLRRKSLGAWFEPDARFEEEFKKRDFLGVGSERIEVLDISPTGPGDDRAPVFFIPGYGDGSPEGRKTNIRAIYEDNRRVLTMRSPRGVEGKNDSDTLQFPETLMRQVNAIIAVLDQRSIEKVAIIGESRGGALALIAAFLHPERFSNIILVDSSGMVDKTSSMSLIFRFIADGAFETANFIGNRMRGKVSPMAKEQVDWGTARFWKWALEDPKLSIEDVKDMARGEVFQLLKAVKAQGVGISIIHGAGDEVFPMRRVQGVIGDQVKQIKDAAGLDDSSKKDLSEKVLDGFYSVEGRHGRINTQPERYTRAALIALAAAEAKQAKEQKEQ